MHAQHHGAQENPTHAHSSTSHQRSVCWERGMVHGTKEPRVVSLYRLTDRQADCSRGTDNANMARRHFRMEGQKELQ